MLLTILLCAGLVGLDQWLKWLAVVYVKPAGVLPGIEGLFQLRYVENDGAAFSILAGQQGLLIVVTGLALLVVAWLLLFKRPQDKLEYLSLVCIFSGGVGNLIDRVANGYVVDYIDLQFMRFAVFNLADVLVCVGFGMLIVAVLRAEWQQRKLRAAQKAAEEEGLADGDD